MNDEQLDLVDQNDIKIGTIGRSKITQLEDGGGKYVRTACAFIRNAEGKLWTPRRTADKRIAPNGLDFAMAEHMAVDETYLDAAIRGFQEELNLSISKSDLRLVGILAPREGLPYFSAIYLHETDAEPAYNASDFVGAEWLTPEEITHRVSEGDEAKSSLVPSVKLLQLQDGLL